MPRDHIAVLVSMRRADCSERSSGRANGLTAKLACLRTPRSGCRPTPNAPDSIPSYAGHSLRSGFLTSAAARGASIFKMADQSRHKSMDTLRGYVRDAEIFKDHAGDRLL